MICMQAVMPGKRSSDLWGGLLLVLLPVLGVEGLFHLTTLLCMVRAEPAYAYLWLGKVWLWFAVCLLGGIVWISLLLMLVRHARQRR